MSKKLLTKILKGENRKLIAVPLEILIGYTSL